MVNKKVNFLRFICVELSIWTGNCAESTDLNLFVFEYVPSAILFYYEEKMRIICEKQINHR